MNRLLLLLDPAFVVLFAAVGRDTHGERGAFGEVMSTAAPFLIAVTAGWGVARVWRDPAGIGAGAVVTAVTLAGGMVLRSLVFGEGTAPAFVVVAALVLAAFLLGWRLLAGVIGR